MLKYKRLWFGVWAALLVLGLVFGVWAADVSVNAFGTTWGSYETVTCVSDTGVISLIYMTSFIVTDADTDDNMDNISLADGVTGQPKIITYKTDTSDGDSVQVWLNLSGGASIILESIEDGVTLVFDGTNWNIAGSTPGVGIP